MPVTSPMSLRSKMYRCEECEFETWDIDLGISHAADHIFKLVNEAMNKQGLSKEERSRRWKKMRRVFNDRQTQKNIPPRRSKDC